MQLYHITKAEYLTSILTEGLKINSGKTGFCGTYAHKRYKSIYGMQPIFLTNDIEFIARTMLTNSWVKDNKAVVLKVNVELNVANSSQVCYKDDVNGVEPKEFRYFSNIEPNDIEIVNVDFKKIKLEY